MNKKLLYSILLIIIILLIFALVYFLLIKKMSVSDLSNLNLTKPQAEVSQTVEEVKNNVNQTKEAPKFEVSKKPITKEDVARVASNFAERFGSYSNHANFKNLSDLEIMMTSRMKAWAEDYLAQQKKASGEIETYYGITTKAASTEVKEFDNNTATILVHTRRQEASETTSNITKVYNQDVTVKLVKDGEDWKVDSANWQE